MLSNVILFNKKAKDKENVDNSYLEYGEEYKVLHNLIFNEIMLS